MRTWGVGERCLVSSRRAISGDSCSAKRTIQAKLFGSLRDSQDNTHYQEPKPETQDGVVAIDDTSVRNGLTN